MWNLAVGYPLNIRQNNLCVPTRCCFTNGAAWKLCTAHSVAWYCFPALVFYTWPHVFIHCTPHTDLITSLTLLLENQDARRTPELNDFCSCALYSHNNFVIENRFARSSIFRNFVVNSNVAKKLHCKKGFALSFS